MIKLAVIKPPKDGKCTRCGEYPDFRGLQKHHKVARSQGGKDTKKNLEWLCGKCHNGPKGHRTENISKSKPVDKADSINVLLGHYGKKLRPVTVEMQCGTKRK